jgi:RNA polymerase sigma factor (sigma-70 family)
MDELEELIARVKHGEPAAYAGIVRLCEAGVRVAAAAIVHHREAVSDVAQEAFVTAYGRLDEYRPGTNFPAWLATITRNLALNHRTRYLRKLAFEKRYQAEVGELLRPAVESLGGTSTADVLPALRQCVEEMSAPARDVVRQFYFGKRPTRTISDAYGRPESWARVVLHRARAALGDCLKRKGILTRASDPA